jgi:uncharacterized protein (TIGR03067 family)
MRAAWLIGLAVTLLVGARALSKDEAGSDSGKVVGKWTIVTGEKEGQKEPPERIKGTMVEITKDTITVTDPSNKRTYEATYKLDTSKKPWVITMTALNGPDKGKTAHGIMKMEGDNLWLCYALPRERVPASFSTQKGSGDLMFVMHRAK